MPNRREVLLSVIIPSYNQGTYIEEALLSILSQATPDVEVLVLDGGSTDNSCEIIKKYESQLSYWQSCKDKGQSDAINQGINRAKGEYVTWLNSDDVFLPNAMVRILSSIKHAPNYHWFLGNTLWMDKEGKILRDGKVEKECWFWNKRYLFSNGGPSAIMHRKTLLQIGLLREDFHYMMDTELWYRFVFNGYPFKRINQYIWGLRLHEAAKMSGHNFTSSPLADKTHPSWQMKQREVEILKRLYPKGSCLPTIWRCSKILSSAYFSRLFRKSILGQHYSTASHK